MASLYLLPSFDIGLVQPYRLSRIFRLIAQSCNLLTTTKNFINHSIYIIFVKIHYGWIVAIGGFITQALLLLGMTIIPLTLPMIREALKITYAESGMIMTAFGIANIVGTLLWGFMSDKIGLRRVFSICALLASIGIICVGLSNSLLAIIFSYALVGLGCIAFMTLIPKLVGAWFHITRRGVASSIVTLGGVLPSGVYGILIPSLAATYGWQHPYYLMFVVALIMTAITFILIRDRPEEKGLKPVGAPEEHSQEPTHELDDSGGIVRVSDVLKMKVTWHLGIFFLVFFGLLYSIMTFLVTYLMEEVRLEALVAGGAYSLFMLMGAPGQILWGVTSDRSIKKYGSRKYILGPAYVIAALLLFLFITFARDAMSVYIITSLIGFFLPGCMPVMFATVSDYYDLRVLGIASGIVFCFASIGMVVFPPLQGYLSDLARTLSVTFQVSAVLALVAGIIALALKKVKR